MHSAITVIEGNVYFSHYTKQRLQLFRLQLISCETRIIAFTVVKRSARTTLTELV